MKPEITIPLEVAFTWLLLRNQGWSHEEVEGQIKLYLESLEYNEIQIEQILAELKDEPLNESED